MTQNQSTEREIYIQLLHEIYLKQNRIGYYFLFFIYAMSLKLTNDKQMNSAANNGKSPPTEILTLMKIYCEFTKERQNEIRNDLKAKHSSNNNNSLNNNQSSSNESNDSDNQNNSVNSSDNDSDNKSSNSSSNSINSDQDENNNDDNSSDWDSCDRDQPNIEEADMILGECFMQDLRLCQQDDPHMFFFMLPFICGSYMLQNYMCNNSELVYLVCSCIDARQLKDLIASVTSQEIVLLKQFSEAGVAKKVTRTNASSVNSRTVR